MTHPDLFIGVVSHRGSRFSVSHGEDGLAARLARGMRSSLSVRVKINVDDRYDPRILPVDRVSIQASLTAQQKIEDSWIRFLHPGVTVGLHQRWKSALRWGLRQWRRFAPPDDKGIIRLINIELSHTALLEAGVASGAPWILVLEDDADSLDLADCIDGLIGLMSDSPAHIAYINVSQSFDVNALGITSLLHPSTITWAGPLQRAVFQADRPVTNTVCAILYRTAFASALLREWSTMPLVPVIPIDWKLNAALMTMFNDGRISPGDCLLVCPAPIDQLSMRVES